MHSLTSSAKAVVGLGYCASFAAAIIGCSGGTTEMTIDPGLKFSASASQTVKVNDQLTECLSSKDGTSWTISIQATVTGQGSCHLSPIMKGSGEGYFQWSSQGKTGTDKIQLSFDLQGNSVVLSGPVTEGRFQGKEVELQANIDHGNFPEITANCEDDIRSVPFRSVSFRIDG